jgi:hypothetical protein
MAVFTIQSPDGRKIRIQADDEATAMRGAQEWALANPVESPEVRAAPGTTGDAAAPEGLKPGTREYADWAAQQARAGKNLPQVSEHQTAESSVLDPFVQGVTFGWGDELRGVAQGAMAAAQGGDFGSTYTQTVDESRNALDRERRVNPIGSVAAEMAGAIPTGMLAGGQLAGKGATLLGRMVSTGGVGLGQGALYGAGASEGDLQDRATSAAVSGLVGAGVGAAVPLAGNAISNFVQKGQQGRILSAAAKTAPASTELKSAASQVFEQATGGTPLAISDNAFFRFLGGVKSQADKLRINTNLDQKSVGLLEMMMQTADDVSRGGTVVDMKDLHIIRQAAQKVATSSEGRDAAFANTIIRQFDDFVQTLKPTDILGGADPAQSANALMKGISGWSRANKVGMVEEAIRVGQMAASGPEKGVRNALRSLARNPETWRRFSAAEQQAIMDVVNGTPGSNLLKLIGTFGFGGNTATNGIGGAAGMFLGNTVAPGVGMVAAPVIGAAAKAGSERMTQNLANRALGAVATEGLKVLPRVNPNQATPIEVLLRRAITPNAGGSVAPR